MPFQPGHPKVEGRKASVPNKFNQRSASKRCYESATRTFTRWGAMIELYHAQAIPLEIKVKLQAAVDGQLDFNQALGLFRALALIKAV